MKPYLFALALFGVLNCNKDPKDFSITIHNNTPYVIDSIKVASYNLRETYFKILPEQKIRKNFKSNYSGKGEGAFLMSIYVKDSIKSQTTFGYYSNSADIKSTYTVKINSDFSIKEIE